MIKSKNKQLLTLLLFLLSLSIAVLTNKTLIRSVFAQNSAGSSEDSAVPDLDLAVFPPSAYLVVKPGSIVEHQVVINYEGAMPVYLTPVLVDFETDGLTGQPILKKPSQLDFISFKNSDWQLNQATRVKPDSKLQLTLEVSPPVHARLEEYPLSLVLTAKPSIDIIRDGSRAQASGAVASNIILSVQPDFKNLGELIIEQIKLPKIVDSFQSIDFKVITRNEGRNAVAAQGEIELTHLWSGKTIKHWFIYPDVVLAKNTRQLRGILADPSQLEPGQEIEFEELSYKPAFLLGPYRVTVELSDASQAGSNQSDRDQEIEQQNFDEQDLVYRETQEVLALPFSVLGLLVLGLIMFVVYSRWEKKKHLN